MFSIQFWMHGRWNLYNHAGPFADESSAAAYVRRLQINTRRSGLPGCEYRIAREP